jgi:multimeric flavodoxin WrbA
MKVLLINGSPHQHGNTAMALEEAAKSLNQCGVETETVWIGNKPVRGCIACNKCKKTGTCTFRDELYDLIEKSVKKCDGLIVGSPVYYAGPNGSLCAILDRVFYSGAKHLEYKPSASVAVCRRGGASATFDRINKYFTINNMPIVSSQYWNSVHGAIPGEALEDLEGMQTMRMLGKNMAWMLKSLRESNIQLPEKEQKIKTNFIR